VIFLYPCRPLLRFLPSSPSVKSVPSSLLKAYRAGNPADFQSECIELFAELVYALGLVPEAIGQIYGLLYGSPEPLSFSNIVERLDISKGSASQGLQLLSSLGAVQEVSRAEDRRELFMPELGLRKLVGGVLCEKVEPLVNDVDARLRRMREHVRGQRGTAAGKFCLERVEKLETWRRQIGLLLPVLKTILGSRRV
jgi:DNA-binding transcriptional regulator GbsR (MarR family)